MSLTSRLASFAELCAWLYYKNAALSLKTFQLFKNMSCICLMSCIFKCRKRVLRVFAFYCTIFSIVFKRKCDRWTLILKEVQKCMSRLCDFMSHYPVFYILKHKKSHSMSTVFYVGNRQPGVSDLGTVLQTTKLK